MVRIPALAVLLLAASACSSAPAARTKPFVPDELRQYRKCNDTSNCIRVDNGCCDCANGGGTISINREFDKQFHALFDCKKVMCTQRAGTCLFREPVCKDGFCELGPQKQLFPKK